MSQNETERSPQALPLHIEASMVVSLRFLLILMVGLSPCLGFSATFTSDESQAAQVVGRESVLQSMKAHRDHIARTGIGLYYGISSEYSPLKRIRKNSTILSDMDRFGFVKMSLKKTFVQTLGSSSSLDAYVGRLVGIQDADERYGDLQMISSVIWALKHVRAAYEAAEKTERADQIYRIVMDRGGHAKDLIVELQKDGWHSIYWNPDVALPDDDKKASLHLRSWQEAQKGTYFNNTIKVDYLLTNYRPTKGSKTKKDLSSLKKLKRVPFWVGLANYGRHIFVGYQDHLSEAHSAEMPTSNNLIMDSEFGKWHGHYPSEKLLSGIIMVPPGSL